MDFLKSIEISASGLSTQRRRMDVIASNLSNIETTRNEKGEPYRRKMIVVDSKTIGDFGEIMGSQIEGVQVEAVVEDPTPFKMVYNPGHPDADENGYLRKPNVELVVEMTNMMMARRTYEANMAAIKSTRQMVLKALEIGK